MRRFGELEAVIMDRLRERAGPALVREIVDGRSAAARCDADRIALRWLAEPTVSPIRLSS